MSIKAFPLNQQEYSYNAQDVMKYYAGRNSGVFETGENLKVSANGGLEIRVNSGMGWLSRDYVASVAFWNESVDYLMVDAGHDTYDRIDLVVVSWNFIQQEQNPRLVIRKGTPASSPSIPLLVNDSSTIEIALARINVGKGDIELSDSDIVDLRGDDTYCPMVYDEQTIREAFRKCVGFADGVNKISDFPNATPASSDKILIEQGGEGKSVPLESLPIPTSVQGKLETKANITYVDNELAKKADITYVDGKLANKADKSELAVERARIDSLSKLSEGSTTGDAELIDLRIGADGVTYGNAGTAVRTQINELKGDISEFKNDITSSEYILNSYSDTKFSITKKANQYINGVGSYQSLNGYDSYEFQVKEQSHIYFKGHFVYLTMAVYSATPISSDTIIGSRMKESTIPTEENPYTVDAGNYVVITVFSDPLAFFSDYRNYQIKESVLGSVYASAFRVNTQYDTDFLLTAKLGKYTEANGAYVDNNEYNSYEIIGTENTQIYFDSSEFVYLSLCVYNGTPSSETLVGSRMRGDDLPTSDNPYSLISGYYAVISIANSDKLSFYSNYKNIVLNNKVRLASTQIQQVKDSLDTNLTRMYVTSDIQSDHITLSMYTQISDNKKLRVDLYKYVYGADIGTPNANSNVWVMGGVYITDNSLTVQDTVVLPVEWDCAIKEVGASDFMGGKQHGDEIYDAYYIYADGKLLNPTQPLIPFYCDSVELVQTSKLNRVGQPTDYLLKHSKHIKITPKNVFCEQSFKALQTFQVNFSYSAMLPIAPTYADAFIRNGKAELEDINSESYTVTNTKGNKVWANIVSDNGLIRFEADSNSDMIPAFAITKGTNDRKCYYTMNADNGEWAENKIMYSHFKFSFDVN